MVTPKDNYINLDEGCNMHYRDWPGKGLPIVAVHGSLTTCRMWDQFAKRLEGAYRLIAPDMPGYGDTTLPEDDDLSVAKMVASLLELIHKIGLSEFHLMGHSMGTRVCGAFSLQYPEKVKSLILVDTSDFAITRNKEEKIKTLKERKDKFDTKEEAYNYLALHEGKNWPEDFLKHHVDAMTYWHDHKLYHKVTTPVLIKIREYTLPSFYTEAEQLKCPVLILRGQNSPVLKNDEALWLKEKIPNSFYVEIEDAGHFIVQEQFEIFAKTLEDFLLKVN